MRRRSAGAGLADHATAVEAARAAQPDVVIGFGGGSALDVAKLVSVMLDDGRAFDDISGINRAPARKVALMKVPTTAGTGSEAATRTLVTEPAALRKIATTSPQMLEDMVILDPELTISLPTAITATSGVDALAHCAETSPAAARIP